MTRILLGGACKAKMSLNVKLMGLSRELEGDASRLEMRSEAVWEQLGLGGMSEKR